MIKLARESRGLTQKELSKLVGIEQGSLSKIELGIMNVNNKTIELISKKLDYPISFFEQNENIYNLELLYYRRYSYI